jgi:predicted RNA-binding protein with TRAM domain
MSSKLGLRMNTINTATTQYLGIDFVSLAVFGDIVIGGGTSGIFKFEGETDNGTDISAEFKTFSTDLGLPNEKRMRNLTLFGQMEGDLEVYPVVEDDEGELHTIAVEESMFQRKYVVFVNRDNQGMSVGVRVKNVNSSYFLIDSIDVLPVVLGIR